MIIYSNPYRTDINIGKAYNDFINALDPIKALQDDPWIVLQDGDILYLTPAWGAQIEKAVYNNKDQYQLIGCMTNRVGQINQLHQGCFEDNMDMEMHRQIAILREKMHWAEIREAYGIVAGFFLLFRYSTWLKVGGFKEGRLDADRQFNNDILAQGGKIGIMPGLYVFHAYRMRTKGRMEAQSDYSHLLPKLSPGATPSPENTPGTWNWKPEGDQNPPVIRAAPLFESTQYGTLASIAAKRVSQATLHSQVRNKPT